MRKQYTKVYFELPVCQIHVNILSANALCYNFKIQLKKIFSCPGGEEEMWKMYNEAMDAIFTKKSQSHEFVYRRRGHNDPHVIRFIHFSMSHVMVCSLSLPSMALLHFRYPFHFALRHHTNYYLFLPAQNLKSVPCAVPRHSCHQKENR